MHLLVLILVVSSTYAATEYEDYETQEQIVDEELLSEIFEQNELELRKIDNNLNIDQDQDPDPQPIWISTEILSSK